ncbi:MAG: hypothetical protein IKX22_09325 [Prevotella sp.]|nr:hypothetical protein [Prevotella sp.]
MAKGKDICEVLKDVRRKIAAANDIDYEPRVCHHEGDCMGTCPACEAEVRYIENELNRRRRLGKAVVVTGLSLGLAAMAASCSFKPNGMIERGRVPSDPPSTSTVKGTDTTDVTPQLDGMIQIPRQVEELEGDVPYEACVDSTKQETKTTKKDKKVKSEKRE